MEGRSGKAECDTTCFHIGGPTPDTPCLAVGDIYSAVTKLAVGSYTSPGTNALTVTGAVSMPGTGQISWSVSRSATGIYIITWVTVHPSGANYIVTVAGQGINAMVRTTVLPTSTSFQVSTYTNGTSTLADGIFSFMVLAS